MKQRKENEVPLAMLNNQEPIRKMSKLVLPEPQISDQVIFTLLLLLQIVFNVIIILLGITTSC